MRKLTRLAYVPQDSLFEPQETVRSVLTAALDRLALEDEQKHIQFQVMLGRGGFEDPDVPAATLSGGWKKRLAIARGAGARARSPADGRAHQPPRPRRHPVARARCCSRSPPRSWSSATTATSSSTSPTRMLELDPVHPPACLRDARALQRVPRARGVLRAQAEQQEDAGRQRCGARSNGSGAGRRRAPPRRGRGSTRPGG